MSPLEPKIESQLWFNEKQQVFNTPLKTVGLNIRFPVQYKKFFRHFFHDKKRSFLSSLLSYLVFENPSLLIGLELCTAVFLYTFLINITKTNSSLPLATSLSSIGNIHIVCWIFSSLSLALFDRFVIAEPRIALRKSKLLCLQGKYPEAFTALNAVSPFSANKITCPPALYYRERAYVFVSKGNDLQAKKELLKAKSQGLPAKCFEYYMFDICLSLAKIEEAGTALKQLAHSVANDTQVKHYHSLFPTYSMLTEKSGIRFFNGLFSFIALKDYKRAKLEFTQVLESNPSRLPCGEDSHILSKAYLAGCKLWTGYAEEGLEELNRSIFRLRTATLFEDRLRPHLSQLLLERANYFAKHQNLLNAKLDTENAKRICSFPIIQHSAAIMGLSKIHTPNVRTNTEALLNSSRFYRR